MKLKKKWVGSWTIMKVLYNGTYKVADHMDVRKQPINEDYLKMYHIQVESQMVIQKLI